MAVTSKSERLFKTKEAADVLGRSTYTIRDMVHKGELAVIRRSSRGPWWFRQSDLEKWVQQHRETL